MGNSIIENMKIPENIEKLSQESDINPQEIKRIYNNFLLLDKQGKGYVSVEDFCKLKEISSNPLKGQICLYLAKSKRMDEISFERFLILIDTMTNKSSQQQKNLLFEICDSDKDGKINSYELFHILELILGFELKKEEIEEITQKTLIEFSHNQKELCLEEFLKIFD